MPIATVTLQNTFDTWRIRTNEVITQVNLLGSSAAVLSVGSPTTNQVLVYDGTFFKNVSMHGDATIDSTGHMTVTGGTGSGSPARSFFLGSMKSLF